MITTVGSADTHINRIKNKEEKTKGKNFLLVMRILRITV